MDLIKENGNTIAHMEHIGRSYRLLRKQYGNGDLIQYVYDHGRRLTTKETKNLNTNSLINKYEYGYNKVHMKTFEQRMHDNSKGDVYDYDELYRIKNVKFNVPDPTVENPTEFEKEKTFNFDKLDNILSIVENFNGQTKTITTEIPENSKYSKLNQYASFDQWGLSYDMNGNTTQKGTQHFVYDYRNQLVRVTDGSTITENKYDALGRRLQKVVTSGSQAKTENFYYSGQQVIEVRDGNDQVKCQFIYGNGIDEVIRMDNYNGTTVTPYYFHSNAIGSTSAVTDANGNVVERYRYGLFGMPTFMEAAGNVIPKSSIGNYILFQGREYEHETNFYYFRARHLDPIMGRFLQTDSMGYEDSLNLYQAFNINPVNFVDPMGKIIYLTGSDPAEDFVLLKKVFRRIGHADIDRKMILINTDDGKYYVDLVRGKGTLSNAIPRRVVNSAAFKRWMNLYTDKLKLEDYDFMYKQELEELFEWLILDRYHVPIEFRTGERFYSKDQFFWFDFNLSVQRMGGGVTVEPFETKSGNIEVVVDPHPNHQSSSVDIVGNLPLDTSTIIVHEFGHAYANMFGFFGELRLTKLDVLGFTKRKDPMFYELSVMFENLYRLRLNQRFLRGWHETFWSVMAIDE